MAELKPCPFCGGVGDIESRPSYSQAADTYFSYRGWCEQCGLGLAWHSYEAEAIAAWNTRPLAEAGDRLAEAATRFLSQADDGYISVDVDRLFRQALTDWRKAKEEV